VTIAGKEYVYQGVTDLEVAPLAEVFGTERPEEGTKEYREWERQFMRRFADYSSQRAIAYFLLCAFPELPESVVKYTVRRMPDGTEECKPGRDLRVRLEAKDFEQIVLIISSELKKIEEKLTQTENFRTVAFATQPSKVMTVEQKKPDHSVIEDTAPEQKISNSSQQINQQELAVTINAILDRREEDRKTMLQRRQKKADKADFYRGRAEGRTR
jgi:hypothetical protein